MGTDSGGAVQVLVRIRPILKDEKDAKSIFQWNKGTRSLTTPSMAYAFDACYDGDKTTQDMFRKEISPHIPAVLNESKNLTVFAYGATGTGKTFTMDQVVHLTLKRLFRDASHLGMSHMEVYNNQVVDLLSETKSMQDLPIRENAVGEIVVANLSEHKIKSLDEFKNLFAQSQARRSSGSTNFNSESSRSHSIVRLNIYTGPGRRKGKIQLIDLAGSEDNRKTGNVGERLLESGQINTSLFVLGKVIKALQTGQDRIPYRDSKLTRLLQDGLGASQSTSRCVMMCHIAPTKAREQESYQTLNYASKAKMIRKKTREEEEAEVRKKSEENYVSMAEKLQRWRKEKGKAVAPEAAAPPQVKPRTVKRKVNVENKEPQKKPNVQRPLKNVAEKVPIVKTSSSKCSVPVKEHDTCSTNDASDAVENTPTKLLKAKTLIGDAVELEKSGELERALTKFRAALKLIPETKKLMLRVADLEKRILATDGKNKSASHQSGIFSDVSALNTEIKNVLEREIVDQLNHGTKQVLMKLNGIGEKRASAILEHRLNEPFRELEDLKHIGLTSNTIKKIGKLNTMKMLS